MLAAAKCKCSGLTLACTRPSTLPWSVPSSPQPHAGVGRLSYNFNLNDHVMFLKPACTPTLLVEYRCSQVSKEGAAVEAAKHEEAPGPTRSQDVI